MKKNISILLLIVLAILAVSYFTFNSKGEKEPITSNYTTKQPVNNTEGKNACEQNGNKWEKVGKAQIFTCVIHYSDAGQKCEYSDQCQGDCIKHDMDSSPVCENTNNRFGCGNSVENINNGEGILCID